jgi:hypothetical protein
MDTADVENMFRRLGVREENLEQVSTRNPKP